MRIRKQDDEVVEVQMAPLIDIVFLLLIFFLVATTMKKIEKELPLELPQSAAAIEQPQEEEMLILGVNKAGQKYLGSDPVGTETLHNRLREAAARDPRQRVRIDADRATPYENVVELIEFCQFEGLRNVGLHTRKD